MKNEKIVDVLNALVEINNDRIEGYQTASEDTDEQDLKIMFSQFSQTSHNCRQELANEITSLGGSPTEETKNTGKLFRAWMDVKAALTGRDRKAILNSCEFGEDNAINTYENVLQDDTEYLNPNHISMVNTQLSNLRGDRNKVTTMLDALKVHS